MSAFGRWLPDAPQLPRAKFRLLLSVKQPLAIEVHDFR
jgi:hypothetical protein